MMMFVNDNILPIDGEVFLFDTFFGKDESDLFFNNLKNTIDWKQEGMKMYGKEILFPRLTAWYGDENAKYKYSGIVNMPLYWNDELSRIKQKVEEKTNTKFNSVLLNYYRNGNDSMGWHSDDENELGINPAIASVTFGASRKFQFKHKSIKNSTQNILLSNGSLLLMQGLTQHNWLHQVPKTKIIVGERINLTFRNIIIKSLI
jgi:alkylated DNA repair dioxygenase AlkB